MPFTAIVVDDEPLARDELKFLLSAHPACRVVGEAENAAAALDLAQKLSPDVAFMDIEMRGLSGLEAARRMLSLPRPPLVVFATAYNEYAVRAFELGAVDYILKPFEEKRLAKTIERINAMKENVDDWASALGKVALLLEEKKPRVQKLPVEKNGQIRLLDFNEVVYGRAWAGGARIYTDGDAYEYTGTMAELEERLGKESFLRVHKSYVVNLNRVEGIIPWFKGTYWLVMNDTQHTQIPVSKNQVKDLKAILGLS